MKAKTIPTEQMSRYFHIASIESESESEMIRNADTRVVASRATHMTPMLFDIRTRSSMAWKACQSMQ